MKWFQNVKDRFQLTPALKELKDFSPLTFAAERVFFVFQFVSPANTLFGTRQQAHEKAKDDTHMETITKQRGRWIDWYVLCWLFLLTVFALLAPEAKGCIAFFCVAVPLFRVFDILQTAVNMTLFDHLRIPKRHSVSGITRTLFLSLWNYLEIVFSFGIVYSVLWPQIKYATRPLHGYYLSVITQLTIGYGDLQPLGSVRIIAPLQGIVGFVFAILVIARFVMLMPRIGSVQKADLSGGIPPGEKESSK